METGLSPEKTAQAVVGLEAVIEETRLLFHRLRRLAEEVHGQGELSAGRRGVLKSLARGGPQTVPQMARARPVSRQHIQMLVNPLAEEGYVELVANPHHKRSKLVRLTRKGMRLVAEIDRREARIFRAVAGEMSTEELATTTDTLRRLREIFAGRRVDQLIRQMTK